MAFLVEGRIPPKTECIFRSICPDARDEHCSHQGVYHEVPFSCGYARAFDLLGKNAAQAVDKR